jgi:transposase
LFADTAKPVLAVLKFCFGASPTQAEKSRPDRKALGSEKEAPSVKRVIFETGPLSEWFYHSPRTEGLPAICIDARYVKAALDMATNKADANGRRWSGASLVRLIPNQIGQG